MNDKVPVALTPKAFDVLAALVERSGRLVEKDELLQIVWADSFVEEANVARIIHTLRKILGENENGNKMFQTNFCSIRFLFGRNVEMICRPGEIAKRLSLFHRQKKVEFSKIT